MAKIHSFIDDKEKMANFVKLSKTEFIDLYHITESVYDMNNETYNFIKMLVIKGVK